MAQQNAFHYACAVDVSVQGGSDLNVEGFRNHIENLVSPHAIENIAITEDKQGSGVRMYGKVTLKSVIKKATAVKAYAQILGESSYNGQQVRAEVDPASLVPRESLIVKARRDSARELAALAALQNGGANPAAVSLRRVDLSPPPMAVGVRIEMSRSIEEDEEEEEDAKLNWKNSKLVATKFFESLSESQKESELASMERDRVSQLFYKFFLQQVANNSKDRKRRRYIEGLVMSVLRRQKLMQSKRYSDGVVVCSFARADKTFAPTQERKTARDKLMEQRKDQQANRGGVEVAENPTTKPKGPVMPMNYNVAVKYPLSLTEGAQNKPIKLVGLGFVGGSHKHCFQIQTKTPLAVKEGKPGSSVNLSFQSRGTGVYRVHLNMVFQDAKGTNFSILRHVLLRSGDSDMYDILKPQAPFEKKRRKRQEKPVKEENVMDPPRPKDAAAAQGNGAGGGYKKLKPFKVPVDVRELVENREMEGALQTPSYDMPEHEFSKSYTKFWQNLLWVSELQAYEDIKLFDMEDATLERAGRFFKLTVAGLAEGRPSVLRGDIVECFWQGKKYRGRVFAIELLDLLLEFHASFHTKFDVRVDRVDRIRFTFTRTAFRTSHVGSRRAPRIMGQNMLMPKPIHMARILSNSHHQQRKTPQEFSWASQNLNAEQKHAVLEIASGTLRPMPYCIFGPPGTGKTTTLVEAVYQLARLHMTISEQPKLKILLVAPSNDASDILVEKLAAYFPPSEMMRVLAYTRTMDQVPAAVKPYVREGFEPSQVGPEIMNCQIVVSTVNLAARLWCLGEGVRSDYFDVLCVDEAGHATEPEVIGVAATIMKFGGEKPGQLVLSGDPQQLGAYVTSEICKEFGMEMSYMERLIKTTSAYKLDEDGMYPPELVTLLVRNYRSHPSILKLPNEMFYHNKLKPCGDKLTTHSMVKWEHLPSDNGFPVVFHGVDGENMREGNSPSWFNPQEAMEVVNYVKLLTKHSRPPVGQDEIGIITPYARQVQKIRLALKANDLGDVKVGSVETFQGQERRCIIISTVRSENELLAHDLKYNLGFVANEKRFNVAVTRAKALLIVVGNPRVLETDEKNWLPLLRYCRDNKSWVGEEWNENEPSSEDEFVVVEGKPSEDEDEWQVVAQEACGFINREE